MAYECKIVADSIAENGKRLTSFQVTYPLIVHGEHLRHRSQSFSVQSNRAIPTSKVIEMVESDPFIPIHWGKNQKGMVADEQVAEYETHMAKCHWLNAMSSAVTYAKELQRYNIHKQIVNRLLMPYQWVTVLCTATEWDNFWHLRLAPNAEPHIRKIAMMMRNEYVSSTPKLLKHGEWHCPYIWEDEQDLLWSIKLQLSPARCARVSYLTHEGKRDHEKDFDLCKQLAHDLHMSPFEHQATPYPFSYDRSGNFWGWDQMRGHMPNNVCMNYKEKPEDELS